MAPTALQYFDSTQPVTIQVDASQKGLGAVLLQANGPVEFASKLLSDTESRYSNIEREMLAVLFDLEKFHYYAYGRSVVVTWNVTINRWRLSSRSICQAHLPVSLG